MTDNKCMGCGCDTAKPAPWVCSNAEAHAPVKKPWYNQPPPSALLSLEDR